MKTLIFAIALVFAGSMAYTQVLTDLEKSTILRMREDEKMAHDVYLTLNEKWNQKVFANILESENYHMSQVKMLIDKYKLEDPLAVTNDARGVFVNQDIQRVYNELIASGSVSLLAAYKAGALIEETDIKELKEAMLNTEQKDIRSTYHYLEGASENHLVAFVRNIDRLGVNYVPVVLSKEEFNMILDSNQVR